MGDLGAIYASAGELKDYMKLKGVDKDATIDASLATASRDIERFCNRQFNKTETASARRFRPDLPYLAQVDDFWTVDGLTIETGSAGTFPDTWTVDDFELDPADGIWEGQSGWPFSVINAVGGHAFPANGRQTLKVTAKWGWAAVPAAVKQACLILAARLYKYADMPFGVGGFDNSFATSSGFDMNMGAIRIRDSQVRQLLEQYRRIEV